MLVGRFFLYISSLENLIFNAAESVSARSLIKSDGYSISLISILLKSFKSPCFGNFFFNIKSSEITFAVEVSATLNFSFKLEI